MATVWKSNGNRVLGSIKPGDEVTILDKSNPSFYLVALGDGTTGYVPATSIELDHTVPGVPSEDIQERQVRDQYFRIYRSEKDTNGMSVRVWARHVYYDLLGVVALDGKCEDFTVSQALAKLTTSCTPDNPGFRFYTNDTEARITADYSRKSVIEGHLDPDEGILTQSNLRMTRDNFDVFLTPASTEVRLPISYAHNLLGVSLEINEDGIVNRIIPVGEDKDGNPVVGNAVDSPRNDEGTVIRARAIEYMAREKEAHGEDPGMTLAGVLTKLAELAAEDFDKGIDLPEASLRVNFVQLGDTEEYQQYKDLDRLYMGDIVRITDNVNGIDVEAEVTEYDYDVLTGRYIHMGVGVTNAYRTIGSIGAYMLPNGSIGRTKIAIGGIDASRLDSLSVTSAKIGLAAIDIAHINEGVFNKLSADAITAIRGEFERLVAGQITTDELYANIARIAQAEVGIADIGYSQIKDLVAGTAVIREGFGGKLYIDRLAVSEGNFVNLTAGQLIIQGESGALYRLTVDEQGQVITELRQLSNDDIADVSLNAGEKLIKSSITADLLDVSQIFASEALIGAIKAHNIEAHSIGVDRLSPSVYEVAAQNAIGQQIVVEWSNGTILDKDNTASVGTLKIYHQGVDITSRLPAAAVRWERISEDTAGDAVWNANPGRQGTKSISIVAADVDFKGIIRCVIDENSLYSIPTIEDGELVMTGGDAEDFSIEDGELIYEGSNSYVINSDDNLVVENVAGYFILDTQLSNLKTTYQSLSREGYELFAGGTMNIRGGTGANAFGLSTDNASGYLMWAGDDDPDDAPFAVMRDGTMRNGANIYTMNFATEAGPSNPMGIPLFFPADLVAIDKVLLYVRRKPFRATATGAASGGGSEKTSSSGGGTTSGSSELGLQTQNTALTTGGASNASSGDAGTGSTSSVTLTANSGGDVVTSYAGTGATGGSTVSISGSTGYTSTAGSHNHASGTLSGSSHTHSGPSHRHTGGAHTHGIDSHSHTGPSHSHSIAHTHDIANHNHTIPQHTHSVSSHTHTVTIDAHTHDLVYGIYETASSGTFSVTIDGTVRRTNRSDETGLDIADWFNKTGGRITRDAEHTILLTPSALNRFEVQIMVKGTIVTKTIGNL